MGTAAGIGEAKRVLVYGVTGAGKSTVATRLAERTGLPLHLADELAWRPGWVPVPEEEQRATFSRICAEDVWVLDTAYGAWLDVALSRAELVVCLDYPRWLSLSRLLRRTTSRWVTQEPVCNGNTESLRVIFDRDSIILWHFRSFGRKRARMRAWAADPDGPNTLLFTRQRDLDAWLATVGAAV